MSALLDDWAVPGLERPQRSGPTQADLPPGADVETLVAAVEQVLLVVPGELARPQALARAGRLLVLQERLQAATLSAVLDVDARDLWTGAAAGSTRTWLRTLPCGDTGQAVAARALGEHPVLQQAVADGTLSVRTALTTGRLLARVPAAVEEAQLEAVLVDGVGDLLATWAGAACLQPDAGEAAVFEARREQIADVVRTCLADAWSTPAARLAPAFTLAAQVLPPSDVGPGLGLLVDALQPEPDLDAAAEVQYRDRDLTLRKRSTGGWSLRAQLTDEVGQLLYDSLRARRPRHPLEPDTDEPAVTAPLADVFGTATPRPAADDAAAGDVTGLDEAERDPAHDVSGTDHEHDAEPASSTGNGEDRDTPEAAPQPETFGAAGPGEAVRSSGPGVEGTPLPARGQRDHDAFARLLAAAVGRPGGPTTTALSITCRLDRVLERPGAPPGLLQTARGPVPLAPASLARHLCGGRLAVVLTDALGRPVAASGEHRHATRRERRAMTAAWGSACAVNGCGLPGQVPHHVEPFSRSKRTALRDLAPLCEHHHHDVHEGAKTLRLRDGRLIDGTGWTPPGW